MNRFPINAGREEEFETTWRTRTSHLHEVPGFLEFHLLRGDTADGRTMFVSHSRWESQAAFIAWTESEAFRKAHGSARSAEGVVAGRPVFEGFEVVDLA